MSKDHYSYPLNDERQRLLDEIAVKTEATTQAEAIDAALKHYLQDYQQRLKYANEFEPKQLKKLDTSEMRVAYYPKVRR